MKASDAIDTWEFDREPADDSFVRCPDVECKIISPLSSWREAEVYCEDCGEHSVMLCPACDRRWDHVHGPTFRVVTRYEFLAAVAAIAFSPMTFEGAESQMILLKEKGIVPT